MLKTISYSSNNLGRIVCVYSQENTSSAKHLTLCSRTISTRQTPLPQIKTLNPLGYRQQWRKPPDIEMMSSGG